jgi:hypothetical protein
MSFIRSLFFGSGLVAAVTWAVSGDAALGRWLLVCAVIVAGCLITDLVKERS